LPKICPRAPILDRVTDNVDPARLPALRDAYAALRAFAAEDRAHLDAVIAPYRSGDDPSLLMKELIEVMTGLLNVAADSGLPANDLVAHVASEVPSDLRETYKDVGRVLIAVHEKRPSSEQDMYFDNPDAYSRALTSLLNYGTFFAHTLAQRAGVEDDAILRKVAEGLAQQ
jgi:hypothetical protein